MYRQQLPDGTWKSLKGNIAFSTTVYQTAESLTDEQRSEFSVHWVVPAASPQTDYTKNVNEGLPALIDGQWTQTWVVSDASVEEIEQRTADQAASIRSDRAQRLADCDWTQLDDTPLTNAKKLEWATYRQALRDITAQSGFPWEASWPEQPK